MKEKTKEYIRGRKNFVLIVFLTVLTMAVSGCHNSGQEISLKEMIDAGQEDAVTESTSELRREEVREEVQTKADLPQTVWIHICGEVETPGIYELPVGSRVYDCLVLAGGFTTMADTTYYNLAAVISDGMKIEIPVKGECGEGTSYGAAGINAAGNPETGGVNINIATSEQLQTLPGIGAGRAEDIIAYREKHGDFKSTEEIMKVSGIKEATYEKIKGLITVK